LARQKEILLRNKFNLKYRGNIEAAKMEIMENKVYLSYILLGLLYFISKVIFYICGFVYFRGVILGLIAAILTILVGIFAFREYKRSDKTIAHTLAILLPFIIIPLTPIIMVRNLGSEIFQIEKLTILFIFELIAILQIILAILLFKKMKQREI